MQFLDAVKQKGAQFVSENATVLLTAGGVVGTVATAVLTGRAGFKAAEIIREKELEHIHTQPVDGVIDDGNSTMGLSPSQKVKLVWPQFVPPLVTGGLTISAIIFSHRMSAQKAAALAAAYGLAERNLSEYKEKVAEKLTGPKNQQIKDEIRQDRVSKSDGSQVIVVTSGEVLCYDMASDRYFNSTVEDIRRAENQINNEILNHNYATMNEFYDKIGLKQTMVGGELGWTSNVPLEIEFSTTQSPDGKPCITIDFVNMPVENYHKQRY